GEAAADEEAHEIRAPDVAHIGRLGGQLAVDPDAVAGHVGADVAVGERPGDLARVEHVEHRAGLGVALGEEEEVPGQVARDGDQVGLRVAVAPARGGGDEAGTEAGAGVAGDHGASTVRKRTGSPPGGTWMAPRTMPSLGSSRLSVRRRGSPSRRMPTRSLRLETVQVVRVSAVGSATQSARGPGMARGVTVPPVGGATGARSSSQGCSGSGPTASTSPGWSGAGPRPERVSPATEPRTSSTTRPPRTAR